MKIGFVSLGCPKNLVDSEVMMGLSQEGGHTLTPNPAEADVLVVNTCAFIDSAKEESVNTILELAEFKKTGNCKRLVVTGCLGERYRDELKTQIPEIDAVLGTGEVPEIVGAIEGAGKSRRIPLTLVQHPQSLIPRSPNPWLPTYLYDAESPRVFTTPRHFAYIKVAEGCDYKCSFCIIPKLRGHYRSRTIEAIVREARSLAARGVRELILISQDTTFYGRDLGAGAALPTLLRELNAVDGIDWIRLLYLYPTTITDDILDAMAECDKVVQVHRPAAAACGRRRAAAHEASGHRQELRKAAGADPRARAWRLAANDVHRRVSRARRKQSSRSSCAFIRERRLRPRRRVHVLARGRHHGARSPGRRAGGHEEEAPQHG